MKKLPVLKFLLLSFFAFALFFAFLPSISNKASASSVIFQDNFEDGNSDGWTSIWSPNLWQVASVSGSLRFGARIESGGTLIDTVGPNLDTSSYQIDFDYLPITGFVNTNLDFRYRRNSPAEGYTPYEVHFITETSFWTNFGYLGLTPGETILSPTPLFTNQINHIKIILDNQHIQFFLNETKIIDYTDPAYHFSGDEKIGLRISTGAASPTEVWFDNIVVRTLDSNIDLNVPLLKQYEKPWGNQLYNSANSWAAPSSRNISSWGCALTSAAMVFRYHGITKMSDKQDLNPGTLNKWLKSQPDGYVRNGLVNWLALSRLSRITKSNNPSFSHDALEYRRINGENKPLLTEDLRDSIPGILEEPGHFIVGKGFNSSTFLINDPFYSKDDLSEYSNTFLSLGRYIPSSTDLSYIMLVVNEGINISVRSPSGELVGESFIQHPLNNDENLGQISGDPLKIVYFPKPENGEYKINVSAESVSGYALDVYMYDQDGNVKKINFTGMVGPGDTKNYSIDFNKNVTFDTLINDINFLRDLGKIDNFGVYMSLISKAEASKLASFLDKNTAKNILDAMLNELNAQRGKHIIEDAYQILLYDVNYLKTHL